MFEIGEYVINAKNGISKVTEIVELDLSGEAVKPYYLLVPMEESSARVFIPVENAEKRIRKVIDKAEAIHVIDRIPEIEEICIVSEKERELRYRDAINSCEPERLVGIIKILYNRQKERVARGKKSTSLDERYVKMAEKTLYAELAFALGCQKQEMQQMFNEKLSKG